MTGKPSISVLTSLYQSEPYLEAFLAHIQDQTLFGQCEFVLVFNEASEREQQLGLAAREQHPDLFRLIFVKPLETLGASWNKAWKESRAPLVAVWNVDDRRTPDSLERQSLALQQHPEWQLCYGDYLRVPDYASETGDLRRTPAFSRGRFRRAFPQGGAFWMMRRALFKQIGFFDEQFRVGPDLDYSIRLAEAGLPMGRVDGLLGYFTDSQQGLSTREAGQPSDIERTAIQLRYGIFDKVRDEYRAAAQAYRLDEVQNFDEWIALERILPGLQARRARRRPLWALGWLRNRGRALLKSLGLLNWIYRLQKRLIGREL